MGKQQHTVEHIIAKLREAEALQGKRMSLEEVPPQIGISDATYYKRRKEYSGLQVEQVKRLKELEQENSRWKKTVANLTLDNMILKEFNRRIWSARPNGAGQRFVYKQRFTYRSAESVV